MQLPSLKVVIFSIVFFATSFSYADSNILNFPDNESWSTIIGSEGINIKNNTKFEVSTLVNFKTLPPDRVLLLSKLDRTNYPYPGWAIGIKNINDQYYPQVYYKDSKGKGGWHTFSKYNFRSGVDYRFYIIIAGSEFITLYLSEINPTETKPVFLGGISLEDYSIPETAIAIVVGSANFKSGLVGNIKDISIEETKKRSSFYFPAYLIKKLKDDESFSNTKADSKDTMFVYDYKNNVVKDKFLLQGGANWLN